MLRVSELASIKYSTFYLLYNQELTSLTDIKFDFARVEEKYSDEPFDKETFDAVISTAASIRENFIKLLEKSISHPQAKERDYNRLHQANQKREERGLDSKEKETVVWRCSIKKVFLKISENSQENVQESLFNKTQN